MNEVLVDSTPAFPPAGEDIAPAKAPRLASLDILRGLTIAAMITVNDPGIETQSYAPLQHSKWNGITPTDFVFPFFLFMVGVSITLSYSRQLAGNGQPGAVGQLAGNGQLVGSGQAPKGRMIRKIIRRAAILIALGIFLSVFPHFDFANYRIPGVLQRIGIVYLVCAPLFLYTSWKFQAWLGAAILIGYCMVMTLVPVPGYGYSILEPGKNLAAWLDAIVIPGRMWQGTWDPEGILSTFPAFVTGISGMLVGRLVISPLTPERKIIWLFTAGFLSFALANGWHWFFPINKNLWTSSFVLYTSGLACMMLGLLYFVVDVLGRKKWSLFARIYGSNAIAAYLVAEVLSDFLDWEWGGTAPGVSGGSIHDWTIKELLLTGISPELLSFVWALAFCALCFIPIYVLYRKKIFLKI